MQKMNGEIVTARSKVDFFFRTPRKQVAVYNWDTFMVAYQAAYGYDLENEDLSNVDNRLPYVFTQLIQFWNYIDKRNSYALMADFGRWNSLGLASILKRHKSVWLFVGLDSKDFEERAQNLIIKLNNKELTVSDYAVLLYLSYQDAETRKSFEGIPLSVLHEIFDPLANEKVSEWFDETYPMANVGELG
jgi:hypothetical protein